MSEYILSIDAGTTSSRAIIFDKKGKTIGVSQHEFTQFFPKKGWVEHDAMEIWETQLKAINGVLQKTNINASQINALGITNQRETTLLWDKNTGIPIHKAIVWQDRRTTEICNDIVKKDKANLFLEKTGLILDSYFSGTKIKWILDQDPDLRKKAENGEIFFGTIDTWLIWNLTGRKVHVTDVTNASRTLLFNIHSLKWDPELLEILNIPEKILPKIVSCSEKIAYTKDGLFEEKILISGIAGDQQAALFGQMCTNPGDLKNTYGTGCFCIMNTGEKPVKSKNKMLTTIGYQINNKTYYALEGSVFVAGAAVQWLRDQLGIISSASEIEPLAKTVKDNGGVTFIPALAGLAAPYWDPHATGTITGITRGTQKGHLARATLEAIAMRTKEIITAMQKDAKFKFKSLKVDGGASNNNLLMQIQSNLLGVNVIRPKTTETTALGAAFFAGLASGFWSSLEKLSSVWEIDREFNPEENEETLSIINNWEKRILKMSNSQKNE